jgi:hypothetical protein
MTRVGDARRAALETFNNAIASGLGHAAAVEAAIAKYRTFVAEASGYEVRTALAEALAEERAALRSQGGQEAG